MQILIKNATIINEGKIFDSDLLIEDDRIKSLSKDIDTEAEVIIDAEGRIRKK